MEFNDLMFSYFRFDVPLKTFAKHDACCARPLLPAISKPHTPSHRHRALLIVTRCIHQSPVSVWFMRVHTERSPTVPDKQAAIQGGGEGAAHRMCRAEQGVDKHPTTAGEERARVATACRFHTSLALVCEPHLRHAATNVPRSPTPRVVGPSQPNTHGERTVKCWLESNPADPTVPAGRSPRQSRMCSRVC